MRTDTPGVQSVLIVEDDASVRSFIEIILKLEGYTVMTAASGAEALDIVANAVIDLVTIDIELPDMAGLDLAAQLRELPGGARARQLIVSGSTPTPEQSARVDAVLEKPFDFAVLVNLVHAVAAQPLPADALSAELDRIIDQRLVETHYQPIVHLASGRIVGFEALARGPEGSPLRMPEQLFAEAHRRGRLTELDSLCTVAGVRGLDDFAVTPPLVFFNVEPSTLAGSYTPERQAVTEEKRAFRAVVEYTEGAVTRQLPVLLANAERVRARGDIVALDDLGSDVRALAMLPLLKPEIVKLDLAVVQGPMSPTQATIAVAVAAYAEQSGASIVAEGIETETHLAAALALGAHLGQGYLLGRPAPAAAWNHLGEPDYVDVAPLTVPPAQSTARTPFERARRSVGSREGSGALVAGISQQLSAQASALGDQAATFVLMQDYLTVPAGNRRTFLDRAGKTAILGLLGVGVPADAAPGAFVAELDAAEPMAREWAAVVVGPHQATLLCARQITQAATIGESCFEFVLSHDRELAVEVAGMLARRVTPRPHTTRTTALPSR